MNTLFTEINSYKIIVILRGLSLDETLQTASALESGGIHCVEVTFNQKKTTTDTCMAIAKLKETFPKLHIGAGTVLTSDQLTQAYHAGAEFIISPNTSIPLITQTKELGMLSIPGAMTPSEIVNAKSAGADIVKIFPSNNLGISYFKAICAPLNHIPLAAVGGVCLENIQDFFNAGVYCVGIGANIVNKEMIHTGNYKKIQELANTYVKKINNL